MAKQEHRQLVTGFTAAADALDGGFNICNPRPTADNRRRITDIAAVIDQQFNGVAVITVIAQQAGMQIGHPTAQPRADLIIGRGSHNDQRKLVVLRRLLEPRRVF